MNLWMAVILFLALNLLTAEILSTAAILPVAAILSIAAILPVAVILSTVGILLVAAVNRWTAEIELSFQRSNLFSAKTTFPPLRDSSPNYLR